MKTTALFLLLLVSLLSAKDDNYSNSTVSYEQAEKNYLVGIETENCGLRVSSAYHLGEMKSDKAVIPLMNMLKNSEKQQEKLIAALSLIKIGDLRGVYAVKRQSKFCDCERVRNMCARFYNAFVTEKYPDVKFVVFEGDSELINLVGELGL